MTAGGCGGVDIKVRLTALMGPDDGMCNDVREFEKWEKLLVLSGPRVYGESEAGGARYFCVCVYSYRKGKE